MSWLAKIEALKPGDACEFHYMARTQWLPGTVIENGGGWYWQIRDESGVDNNRGQTATVWIENVRLPGQTEAWSGSLRDDRVFNEDQATHRAERTPMLTTVLLLVAGLAVVDSYRSRRALREFKASVAQLPALTPTAQLAAEFRSFVESVDGRVPPELDALLERVMAPALVVEVKVPDKEDDLWESFWDDFSNTRDQFYRTHVLRQWHKKLRPTAAQRKQIMSEFSDDYYRAIVSRLLNQ